MPKNLQKQWWFMFPITFISGYAAFLLVQAAGIGGLESVSQMLVFALCFAALRTGLQFVAWLAMVGFMPKLAKSVMDREAGPN
ncbi:hypothetical protein [Undibacterium fentianense]|uniref:Uncharacterized protein n=1 Tax=Undibacterium fentianense TaxID=2828728 RepID=A0A941E8H9_9BURK|nr:hypothetical protein [Undibacterium fentianense]MBR7801703.1 hypothetical protein [Undibacterium fentianense]